MHRSKFGSYWAFPLEFEFKILIQITPTIDFRKEFRNIFMIYTRTCMKRQQILIKADQKNPTKKIVIRKLFV